MIRINSIYKRTYDISSAFYDLKGLFKENKLTYNNVKFYLDEKFCMKLNYGNKINIEITKINKFGECIRHEFLDNVEYKYISKAEFLISSN